MKLSDLLFKFSNNKNMSMFIDNANDRPILVISWSSTIVTLIFLLSIINLYTLDFATISVSKNENSLPLLTFDSTQIFPLWASIICLDKYNPKPVPVDRLRLVPCENLLNRLEISSLGIPFPLSATEKIKSPCCAFI